MSSGTQDHPPQSTGRRLTQILNEISVLPNQSQQQASRELTALGSQVKTLALAKGAATDAAEKNRDRSSRRNTAYVRVDVTGGGQADVGAHYHT